MVAVYPITEVYTYEMHKYEDLNFYRNEYGVSKTFLVSIWSLNSVRLGDETAPKPQPRSL